MGRTSHNIKDNLSLIPHADRVNHLTPMWRIQRDAHRLISHCIISEGDPRPRKGQLENPMSHVPEMSLTLKTSASHNEPGSRQLGPICSTRGVYWQEGNTKLVQYDQTTNSHNGKCHLSNSLCRIHDPERRAFAVGHPHLSTYFRREYIVQRHYSFHNCLK